MRPLSRPLVLVPLFAIAMAGCSEDDPKTEKGAEEVVREFHEEFNARDFDDACELMTRSLREELPREWTEDGFGEEATTCEAALRQIDAVVRAFSEVNEPDPVYEVDSVETELDGDRATSTVGYLGEGFGGQVFSLVYDDGDWMIDDMVDVEDDEESEGGSAVEPDETDSAPAEPHSLSESATLGDWSITVTSVDTDAARAVRKVDDLNEAPTGVYVLVTFEAVYNGSARTASIHDLTWSLTTNDARVVDEDAMITTAADAESWTATVRTGGTARGQVVFDVEPGAVDGGLISVETYDDESDLQFADFQL